MKKRILSVLLVSSMLLSAAALAGCGDTAEETTADTTAGTAETTVETIVETTAATQAATTVG